MDIKNKNTDFNTKTKGTSPISSFTSFLKNTQRKISSWKYSYLFFAFFIPVFIMYIVYVAMEIHPFGDNSVLVLDLNGQYVYFFEALRNFVRGDASLLYSFSRALGGEFMGIYAYYLASPFSYIVALFPTERMLEALLVLILLKVGLCGTTMGYYLHKNSAKLNKYIIIAFSTMYALCAYAVVYQNNIMWIDALICLPLITYGLEQLIKFRKYKLFVVSLAVGIMSNFYIGYMLCLWVIIYFFYYFFSQNDGRNNPMEEKKHFLRSLIRTGIFSAIAVAVSAVIVLTAYYALTFGKTTFSDPNWAFAENFKIIDYLTKFLPGSYDTVRPEGLPYVYGGMLMLILVPVYFMTKKISAREKIASLFVILLFSVCFISRPLDLIWHGFQRPNWLNYRYSFMLVFFMLTLAYKGFGNLRKVGEKFLLGVGAIIVIFIAVAQKLEFETYVESSKKLLSLETVWLGILATVAFVALLCMLVKFKNVFHRETVCCVIVSIVCIEIFCSSLTCVVQHDKDVVYSGYSGYNNFLKDIRPAVEELKDYDATFYRFEKTKHRKLNDNMALGIRGLSNSTSTLNASTIKFLNQMGYSSKSHWSKYLGGSPVSDSILGIKYIISEKSSEMLERYYTQISQSGSYYTYQNDNALSIAFGVNGDIDGLNFEEPIIHFDRLNMLVDTMLGRDSDDIFVSIPIEKIDTYNLNQGNSAGHIRYSMVNTGETATVKYTIIPMTDDEILIHLPTGYARECKLSVNGASKGNILGNETERIVSLGTYIPGSVLEVTLTISNKYNDLYLKSADTYFCYFDAAVFEKTFSELKSYPQFITNENCTDDTIEGTIRTTAKDQTILVTIPYDEGWNIYLDGEEVEYREVLGAVIAFDIAEAGEHTLKLAYRSDAFTYGLIISITGIITFFAVCAAEYVIKRKRKAQGLEEVKYDDILWSLEDFDEDDEEIKNTSKKEKPKKEDEPSDESENDDTTK